MEDGPSTETRQAETDDEPEPERRRELALPVLVEYVNHQQWCRDDGEDPTHPRHKIDRFVVRVCAVGAESETAEASAQQQPPDEFNDRVRLLLAYLVFLSERVRENGNATPASVKSGPQNVLQELMSSPLR